MFERVTSLECLHEISLFLLTIHKVKLLYQASNGSKLNVRQIPEPSVSSEPLSTLEHKLWVSRVSLFPTKNRTVVCTPLLPASKPLSLYNTSTRLAAGLPFIESSSEARPSGLDNVL